MGRETVTIAAKLATVVAVTLAMLGTIIYQGVAQVTPLVTSAARTAQCQPSTPSATGQLSYCRAAILDPSQVEDRTRGSK